MKYGPLILNYGTVSVWVGAFLQSLDICEHWKAQSWDYLRSGASPVLRIDSRCALASSRVDRPCCQGWFIFFIIEILSAGQANISLCSVEERLGVVRGHVKRSADLGY